MRAVLLTSALLLLLGACDGNEKGKSDAESDAKPEAKDADGPKGAFSKYQARSMASEAKINVSSITSSLRAMVMEERVDPGTMEVVTGQLPESAPLTPPAGTCCKQPKGQCPPDMGDWDHETWKALGWKPSDPHRYSYEVAVEGQSVTVRAVGDLDCDGNLATYETTGEVVDGELSFPPSLLETSPLE